MGTLDFIILALSVGLLIGLWIDAQVSINKMDRATLEHVITVSDKVCAQNGGVKSVNYQSKEFTVFCNNKAVFYDLKYK